MKSVRPDILRPLVAMIANAEISCAVEYKIQNSLIVYNGIKLNVQFVIMGSMKDEIVEGS